MAFGKKKEKEKKVKIQTVSMSQNPLYQQQESQVKEVLSALAIAFVAVVLFCLIVWKFSYYSTGYSYSSNSGYSSGSPDPGYDSQSFVTGEGSDDSSDSGNVQSEEEEIDMSLVDIDAVSNGYV